MRLVGLAAFMVAGAAGLAAQSLPSAPRPEPSVTWALESGTADDLAAGWTHLLSAELRVPDGMHLVRQDDLLGLALAEPVPGLRPGPLRYPEPDYELGGFPVYAGMVRLVLPVAAGPAALGVPWRLEVAWQLCYDDGVCLRPERSTFTFDPAAAPGGGAAASGAPASGSAPAAEPVGAAGILAAFGLAVLGGLVLNVMPCVLPVLALKAVGLAGLGADRRRRRRETAATVAGMLVSMLALGGLLVGFKAAGTAVGWGFQFQSPWYSLAVTAVVFLLALSLLEVFGLPQPRAVARPAPPRFGAGGAGMSGPARGGLVAAFGGGLLTVVLATPCTAPFLGTALGLALALPPAGLLLVFLGIGIGLALPYALVGFLPPGWVRLPKPGPWLDRFKALMAFPLLGTAVWLLGIYREQASAERFGAALWLLLGLGLVALLAGWLQRSALAGWRRRALGGLLAAGVLALGAAVVALPDSRPLPAYGVGGDGTAVTAPGRAALPGGWMVFDEAAVAADRAAGRPVFVDFTAAWCLTCKLNEAGALADPAVRAAFREVGWRLYRGDWTNPDPVISRWLAAYGRAGVPFYLVIRPDGSEQVLPELLTPGMVLEALGAEGPGRG